MAGLRDPVWAAAPDGRPLVVAPETPGSRRRHMMSQSYERGGPSFSQTAAATATA
jgi:hypothetical protein